MECLDESCQAKLHTRKCKRPVKKRQERDGRREGGGPRGREQNREQQRPLRDDRDRRRLATGSGRTGPGGGALGQWSDGGMGRGGGGGNRRNIPVWANERTSDRNQDLQMAGLQKILEAQQQTMMNLFQQETKRFQGEMMMMMLNQGGAMPGGRERQGGGWTEQQYNQHYY